MLLGNYNLNSQAKKVSYFMLNSFLLQTCPMKGRSEDSFLEHFSERFMDHVRQVCTFAKLVPGFKGLHHDDQVTLLKSCVFEVLLVRLSGLFENQVHFLRRHKYNKCVSNSLAASSSIVRI